MHPADFNDDSADADPIDVGAAVAKAVGLDDSNDDVDDPAGGGETADAVEDIQMSPLPFDREDPTTLMELPENIMHLPISPCGPKDEDQ